MSYLDRIQACRRHDLANFRPFYVGGSALGFVRHDMADTLAGWPDVFAVEAERVSLAPSLTGREQRTAAVAEVVRLLAERGKTPPWRGEVLPVIEAWGDEPLFGIDRCAGPAFAVPGFGIHVNGYVRKADGLHLWVARRSPDAFTCPSRLDHLVAGGQPMGLSLEENLRKEAAEEAAVPPELADRALPVGAFSYRMEFAWGLRNDTLFMYDLELPLDFEPRNTDGEVESFALLPVAEVAALVRDTDDFKFNVGPVIIDFLRRHTEAGAPGTETLAPDAFPRLA